MRCAIFLLAYHTVGDFKLTLHNERFPFTMLLNQHDAASEERRESTKARWDINTFFRDYSQLFCDISAREELHALCVCPPGVI